MTSATATRDQTVELATGKVHVTSGGSGDPIVVLHHDNQAPVWGPFYEELSRDHTVIVPDLPGFGSSDRLEWARHPRDLATVLQAALGRIGVSNATVVGLGFGGWLAAEIASHGTSLVKKLVLVNSFGIKPPEGEIVDQMLMDFVAYTKAGFATDERFAQEYGEEPSSEQVLIWDYGREVIARIAWKPYMFSHQLPHLLSNVQVPTTIVWGEQNRTIPISAGREFARVISGAKLEILPATGHYAEIERPEELAKLVRA